VPIYEYRRPDGTTFEVMQRITEDPITHDPETGVPVQRVFHPVAVHFKGKGFYNTDYGKAKRGSDAAASSSGSEQGPPSSDSSSDSGSSSKKGSDSGSGSSKPEASSSSSSSSSD